MRSFQKVKFSVSSNIDELFVVHSGCVGVRHCECELQINVMN